MPDNAETIGSYSFAVAFAAGDDERFERRAETLATWLLARWRAERKEADDGRRDE